MIQLETGRPWWQACCIGCLLFFITAAIAAYAILRVFSGPGPQPIAMLPKNFPSDIELYRFADANSISYLPGSSRGKLFEVISAPVSWLDRSSSSTEVVRGIKRFTTLVAGMDRVSVHWVQLDAKPKDVFAAYEKMFATGGFHEDVVKDEKLSTISAVAKRNDVVIQFLMRDTPENPGIDEMTITIDYLPKR